MGQVENKKSREPRGKQCHTKTVMIRKSYETQRQTPTTSRLGSAWRKKDEGMIDFSPHFFSAMMIEKKGMIEKK